MAEPSGEHQVSPFSWDGLPAVQEALANSRRAYFRATVSLVHVRQPGCEEQFLEEARYNMTPVYDAFHAARSAAVSQAVAARCLRDIFVTEIETRKRFYRNLFPSYSRDFRFFHYGEDTKINLGVIRDMVAGGNIFDLPDRLVERHFSDACGVLAVTGFSLSTPVGNSTLGEELAVTKLAYLSADLTSSAEGTSPQTQ